MSDGYESGHRCFVCHRKGYMHDKENRRKRYMHGALFTTLSQYRRICTI